MAITYHAGRRLQGNETTYTNVTTSSNGSTGNGSNNSSGFSQVTGKIGYGFSQSSGNYAINNQSWGLGNDGWSFNFWCIPQSASGNDYYLQFTETSGWRNVFYMYNAQTENGGGFQPRFIDDIGTNMGLTSVALTNGSWNMITVTWTPTEDAYKVYKNGVLLYTETYTATNAGNFGTPNRNWYLGNYNGTTASTYASRANGMDEWSWWTAPLTQADITELYNGGTGIKAKDLTSANKIKLKVYYDFEDSVNGTLTNQAPTTVISVANQRVVENFSGSVLDTDRWTFRNISGTGTGAMGGSVDGGYEIKPSTGGTHQSQIDFNNIRQYSPTGCAMISVAKSIGVSPNHHVLGLINDYAKNISTAQQNSIIIDTSGGVFRAMSGDGTTWSSAGTVIPIDTNFHTFKVEANPTNILYYADGVLKVTKTDRLPTLPLQPRFVARYTGSVLSIRYAEVYNT